MPGPDRQRCGSGGQPHPDRRRRDAGDV